MSNLTKKEITEELDGLGIEYDQSLRKDDLQALLDEHSSLEAPQPEKTYVVIYDFKDLKDQDTIYTKGDPYPKTGIEVPKERLEELQGKENKIGKPLIEVVESE